MQLCCEYKVVVTKSVMEKSVNDAYNGNNKKQNMPKVTLQNYILLILAHLAK